MPYYIYCHNKACGWQGIRKEDLYKHIDQTRCGPKPKFEEERVAYDADLILGWIRDGVPIDVVQMFAADFAEERARELEKENLWENPRIEFVPQ